MKRIATIVLAFCCQFCFAQDQDVYLLFEFMRVDNEQESSYAETENFWEKIHQQRVQNGDLDGWDLWSLQPGGEDQNFQYLTVQVFSDPVKMMDGSSWDQLMTRAKAAYPNMSEAQIMEKLNGSAKTRDLAVRLYLYLVETTDDDYEMPVGSITRINFMNAHPGQNYQSQEIEVFKPYHQQRVATGHMGSWGLAQVMLPYGTEVYATHLTFDMFNNYQQLFGGPGFGEGVSEQQQEAMTKAVAARDLKWSSMGTLIKKVRKE